MADLCGLEFEGPEMQDLENKRPNKDISADGGLYCDKWTNAPGSLVQASLPCFVLRVTAS